MRFKDLKQEHLEFMQTLGGITRRDAHDSFEAQFNLGTNYDTFRRWLDRMDIPNTGKPYRWTTETASRWSKGLTREEQRMHFSEESYKKKLSTLKRNTVEVGQLTVANKEPYIWISDDTNKSVDERRMPLDRYVWTQHHGEIEDGYILVHLDRNPLNCDIGNLAIIPRGYLSTYTRWMASEFSEVNKTTVKYIELLYNLKKKAGEQE